MVVRVVSARENNYINVPGGLMQEQTAIRFFRKEGKARKGWIRPKVSIRVPRVRF